MTHNHIYNPRGRLTELPIVSAQERRVNDYRRMGYCPPCSRILAIRGDSARVCHDCMSIQPIAVSDGL